MYYHLMSKKRLLLILVTAGPTIAAIILVIIKGCSGGTWHDDGKILGFSAAGKFAIAARYIDQETYEISVRDLVAGKEVMKCEFPKTSDIGSIQCGAVSVNGSYALVGDSGGNGILFTVKTGKEARRFKPGHSIRVCALSSDGSLAAFCDDRDTVSCWSTPSGSKRWSKELVENNRFVHAEFGASVINVVSAWQDIHLLNFDISTGNISADLTFPCSPMNASPIALSPDGKKISAGVWNNVNRVEIRTWNCQTGELISAIKTPAKELRAICFSPDSIFLFAGSIEGKLTAYDSANGSKVDEIAYPVQKVVEDYSGVKEEREEQETAVAITSIPGKNSIFVRTSKEFRSHTFENSKLK